MSISYDELAAQVNELKERLDKLTDPSVLEKVPQYIIDMQKKINEIDERVQMLYEFQRGFIKVECRCDGKTYTKSFQTNTRIYDLMQFVCNQIKQENPQDESIKNLYQNHIQYLGEQNENTTIGPLFPTTTFDFHMITSTYQILSPDKTKIYDTFSFPSYKPIDKVRDEISKKLEYPITQFVGNGPNHYSAYKMTDSFPICFIQEYYHTTVYLSLPLTTTWYEAQQQICKLTGSSSCKFKNIKDFNKPIGETSPLPLKIEYQ